MILGAGPKYSNAEKKNYLWDPRFKKLAEEKLLRLV